MVANEKSWGCKHRLRHCLIYDTMVSSSVSIQTNKLNPLNFPQIATLTDDTEVQGIFLWS